MVTLRHKTFVGPTVYTQGATLNENREAIRARAEAFVNSVGVANVVSVCEHAMTFGPFSVVVWYRDDSVSLDPAPVVQVTNADIGRRLRVERERHAFAPEEAARPGRNPAWRLLLALLFALAGLLASFYWLQ
jgi:hypothetical protein